MLSFNIRKFTFSNNGSVCWIVVFFRAIYDWLIDWFVFAEAAASSVPTVLKGTCLSMDGRRHENEESWHDGCRECYCHNGREMCALITCPVPSCVNPTLLPGQCCPSCSGKYTKTWSNLLVHIIDPYISFSSWKVITF